MDSFISVKHAEPTQGEHDLRIHRRKIFTIEKVRRRTIGFKKYRWFLREVRLLKSVEPEGVLGRRVGHYPWIWEHLNLVEGQRIQTKLQKVFRR